MLIDSAPVSAPPSRVYMGVHKVSSGDCTVNSRESERRRSERMAVLFRALGLGLPLSKPAGPTGHSSCRDITVIFSVVMITAIYEYVDKMNQWIHNSVHRSASIQ